MIKNDRKKFGFTLLEVMIALVILALAFSATFISMSANTRHLIYLQDKTAAGWIGWNVITNAQLGVINVPQNGSINGSDKMFDSDWNWKLTVSPTPDLNVLQLTVDVSKSSNSSSVIVLTGYLLNHSLTDQQAP